MTTDEKLDQIAEEIRRVSKAMRRFRDGLLNRRCVAVLLRDATGLGLNDIYTVIDGMESLEDKYLIDALDEGQERGL